MREVFDVVVPERAPEPLRSALATRLIQVALVLQIDDDTVDALGARGSGVLADMLVRRVRAERRDDELWLLLVALMASFPDVDLLLRVRRTIAVAEPELALAALLEALFQSGKRLDELDCDFEIITGQMVADVDFCARFDHNTGIQRVVRETMSRWNGVHSVRFACWSSGENAFRALSPLEHRRVVDWDAYKSEQAARPKHEEKGRAHLLVPFRTTVLLPEVAHEGLWSQLTALARFSGNQVAMIGYDTIPIASADQIRTLETEKFAKYLTIVKNSTRIAAISQSAADEFSGFVEAVSAQGVRGPHVGCVTLAVESPASGHSAAGPVVSTSSARSATSAEPLVLMVGNQEPRKNVLAVIFAAESLWREGVRFRLRMIGGGRGDYTVLVDKECARLKKAGHPIEVLRGAGDDALLASYREAYFTIFPSTHEGYGLPVAESLAMGIPSITSDFGSTQQIADGGGCLTVDARDDESIIRSMRRLLADPGERDRLATEARARTPRTWNDYAAELWHELAEPLEKNR